MSMKRASNYGSQTQIDYPFDNVLRTLKVRDNAMMGRF